MSRSHYLYFMPLYILIYDPIRILKTFQTIMFVSLAIKLSFNIFDPQQLFIAYLSYIVYSFIYLLDDFLFNSDKDLIEASYRYDKRVRPHILFKEHKKIFLMGFIPFYWLCLFYYIKTIGDYYLSIILILITYSIALIHNIKKEAKMFTFFSLRILKVSLFLIYFLRYKQDILLLGLFAAYVDSFYDAIHYIYKKFVNPRKTGILLFIREFIHRNLPRKVTLITIFYSVLGLLFFCIVLHKYSTAIMLLVLFFLFTKGLSFLLNKYGRRYRYLTEDEYRKKMCLINVVKYVIQIFIMMFLIYTLK